MANEEPISTPTTEGVPDADAWATIKLALTGKELDFTSGPIGRAIVLLAIPMVMEMVMESVFALTDAFFVSRLGTDAVATVGLTEAMISLLFAVAVGTGMATTAMVARRVGERDLAGARVAAAQSIFLGLALTIVVALPGVLFAEKLLALMGGTPELVASGHGYTQVLFGGSATIMLIFLLGIAAVFIIAAGPLIRIFSQDPTVVGFGVRCLVWVSIGYPFYAWGMVMVQAFNGAGDTYTPTVINFFCYWLFQLPLAYALAQLAGFGPTGVFAAITIAESLIAVVGMLVFRRGRWKLQVV